MTHKKLSVLLLFVLMLAQVVSAQTNELFQSKEKSIAIENIYFQLYIDIDKKGDTVSIKRLQDGKLHGRNLVKPWNSKETFITYYYKGEKQGPSIIIDEKGRRSVTNYYKGYKHGLAINYDEKQRIRYQLEYFMGKKDGKEYRYDDDYNLDKIRIYRADTLESETTYNKNGEIEGKGTFVDFALKNQKYYRMIHGEYTFYYPNGDKRITQFDRGLATGDEKMWTASGQLKYVSFMLNDSIRKYYYYDDFKGTDSTEVKFWRPFMNPLYQSDNLGYLFPGGGYIQELRLKDDYSYKEEYHSNGALSSRFSTKDSLNMTYWPNGRVKSNTKIGDRYSYIKRSFDELGEEERVEIKVSKKDGLYHYIKTIKSPDLTEETYHFAKYAGNHINYQFILRNGVLAEDNFNHRSIVKVAYNEQEEVKSFSIKNGYTLSGLMPIKWGKKNFIERLFGGINGLKKNYQIATKDNSIYSGVIEDKVYEIKYLNGQTKLRFELKDSLFTGSFYYGLPDGTALFNHTKTDGSNDTVVALFKELGFEPKSTDLLKYTEIFNYGKDEFNGSYTLNDQLIYYNSNDKSNSHIQKRDPNTDILYEINRGKRWRSLPNSFDLNSIKRIYKKSGKLVTETCRGNIPDDWYTTVYYYKNGNQKQMNTSEFFSPNIIILQKW